VPVSSPFRCQSLEITIIRFLIVQILCPPYTRCHPLPDWRLRYFKIVREEVTFHLPTPVSLFYLSLGNPLPCAECLFFKRWECPWTTTSSFYLSALLPVPPFFFSVALPLKTGPCSPISYRSTEDFLFGERYLFLVFFFLATSLVELIDA